jgi:hypothetical protein
MRKNYAKVLEGLDKLDKAVGGDPYLQIIRAKTYVELGDRGSAGRCAERAIEQDASLKDAYWILVTISLEEEKFDDTLKWLRTLQKKFGVKLKDLTTLPIYKKFVKSPQYQQLQDERAGGHEG